MKALKRSRLTLTTLAYWPQQWVENENVWHMFELQLKADASLDWFLRGGSDLGPVTYDNLEDALEDARTSNARVAGVIDTLALDSAEKVSLKLKVEKAVTVEERLMTEERWMLDESIQRHAATPRPRPEELMLPQDMEALRIPLSNILQQYPYIRYVRLNRFGITLMRKGENDWTERAAHTRKNAIYCAREKIARGFGFSGTDHWGKTKAGIRAALLPRANQLLQETGFKLMLNDALRRGQRVVVSGNFVFWYEEDNSVGWVVKQTGGSDSSSNGYTLWKQGKIVSKNHGRIVVLPYIKENGEFVQGHTKNAPQDGVAKRRHPDHYVELPFEVLDGDLMYDLFGRMRYE